MTTRRKFLTKGTALVGISTTPFLLTACGGGGGGGDGGNADPSQTPNPTPTVQTQDIERGTGLIAQTKEEQEALPTVYGAPVGASEQTPASFDLTTLGFLPPP